MYLKPLLLYEELLPEEVDISVLNVGFQIG